MEVCKIIDLPVQLHALASAPKAFARRRESIGAENDHVKPSGRGVVDPLSGESPNAVKRFQVHLLGSKKLVVCVSPHIIYKVDQERIV